MPNNLSKSLRLLVKLAVTFLIIIYLVWIVNGNIDEYRSLLCKISIRNNWPLITALGILLIANQAFEALKWKTLTSKLEEISFLDAFKAVLTGMALGMVAPKSVGDIIGRFLLLNSFRKYRLLGGLLLGQAIQFAVTLFFGISGAFIYFYYVKSDFSIDMVLGFVLLVAFIIGMVYRKTILSYLFQTELGERIKNYLIVVKEYSPKEIGMLVGLSMFRYVVFTTQYVLVLRLLQVSVATNQLIIAISVVFLIKSLLFSVNFVADMGMRQITAVSVMTTMGIAQNHAMLASFGLWSVNILIPALGGLVIWIQLKLKW